MEELKDISQNGQNNMTTKELYGIYHELIKMWPK